jgi:hypothetical protein
MSASANANIAGHKLDGTMSLSNTAYTPVGFFDVSVYNPFTEIYVDDFDLIIGQPRQAPSPTFWPDNDNIGMSGIWLDHISPYESLFTVDENGLCTATGVVTTAVYTVRSKITSVEGSASVSIVRLPHPDVQNKSHWCWAAAVKKVGINNYGSEVLPTGVAELIDTNGLHSVNWVDYYGMRPGPAYTVDAGQRHIVMEALRINSYIPGNDGNNEGDDGAREKGLNIATLYNMSVGTVSSSNPYTAINAGDILLMNAELGAEKWVVANVFTNWGGQGHSIVVKSVSHNGYDDVYTYWDPWKGEESSFTATDITSDTIQLVGLDGINSKLRSFQYCH